MNFFELRYSNNGREIWFDKLREEFGSLSGIGVKELQAINEKCKELGVDIMDLFNKKKTRELIDELEDSYKDLIKERAKTKELNKRIDNLELISSQTLEENQKLLKWIENILKEFGTVEVRDRLNIKIPIIKEHITAISDYDCIGIHEEERVTIPEITLIKMR